MKTQLKFLLALLSVSAVMTGCATAGNAGTTVAAEAAAPYARPGFYTSLDRDGRLWVFPEGHPDHQAYLEQGRPVRQVRRIAAGPQGQTIISTEAEHIDAYLISRPGFYTSLDRDGRIWVFPEGHPDHQAYLEQGRPVRQVRRIAAGPGGRTVISTEAAHIDAYLAP